MAATYRGARQGSELTAASYALKAPSGTIAGDLILFALVVQTEGAIAISGMTVRQLKGGGYSYVFATALASGSEPTYTATWTGSKFAVGDIFSYKNGHQTTPIAAETTSTSAGTTAVSWPSISPEIGGCLDVIVALSAEQVSVFPVGFTARLNDFPSSLADKALVAAGATGKADGTLSGASAARLFRLAIAPAPGGEEAAEKSFSERLDAQPVLDSLKGREESPLSLGGKWAKLTVVDGNDYAEDIENAGKVTPTGWTTITASTNAGSMWVEALAPSSTWATGVTLAADLAVGQHVNIMVGLHEVYLARVAFGGGWFCGLIYNGEIVQQGEVSIAVGDKLRLAYYGGDLTFQRGRAGLWSELFSHTVSLAPAERHAAFLFYKGEPPNASTTVRLTDFVFGSLETKATSRRLGLLGVGR